MMLPGITGPGFVNSYPGDHLSQHGSTYWIGYDCPGNDLLRDLRGIFMQSFKVKVL